MIEFNAPFFLSLILAYSLGSIPFGLVLTRALMQIDVRTIGSGNIGATNVLRTGNKMLALATLSLDMFKGIAAVWFSHLLIQPLNFKSQCLVAGLAVLGHILPVWLKFKGGKGVATYFGTLVGLSPFLGLVTVILWLGTTKATRISSLGAIVAVCCAPFLAFFITHQPAIVLYVITMAVIVLITHRSNILRLIRRQEPSIDKPSAIT